MAEDECVIKEDDPRLAKQSIEHLVNSVKCRLRIDTDERRSSVYETPEVKSKYVVFGSLAVTNEKLLLDVKRVDKDKAPVQYLCLSYSDQLFRELVLEYSADPRNPQLSFLLPDAGRFLSPGDLGVAEKCAVTVFMSTHKAPDIAMYVNSVIRSKLGDCQIAADDTRLDKQKIAWHLNSMKCRLTTSGAGGNRSSVYGTEGAPSRHEVYAALIVTEEKIILDVKWLKEESTAKQYLNLAYQDPMCCDVGLDYSNDAIGSNLVITLPKAERFLGSSISDLGVSENSTVKVFMETWKAPDVVMHVKQKLRKAHGDKRASYIASS